MHLHNFLHLFGFHLHSFSPSSRLRFAYMFSEVIVPNVLDYCAGVLHELLGY